ncbi:MULTISPECIES: hypothetical protein [Mesorhizobium]|nr:MULTISPECIES: hypothetical protein [Mesorhizobium]
MSSRTEAERHQVLAVFAGGAGFVEAVSRPAHVIAGADAFE